MARLTNKRRVFIEHYLQCWNATEAARCAEYSHPRRQGSRLLSIVDIQEEISRRLTEKAMDADEVLARLAEHARGDVEDIVVIDEVLGGWHVNLEKARRAAKLGLIKEVTVTGRGRQQRVTVKLHDAQAALALLARHHGLLVDISRNLNIDVSQLTNEQLERLAKGEDLLRVLSAPGTGGIGTAET